ncbi:MAG: alkaline phosphatase family protein [Desertimonas sp.]
MGSRGINFQIINQLGVSLQFLRFEPGDGGGSVFAGPTTVPTGPGPTIVRVDDTRSDEGASGTASFIAEVDGEVRQYAWYGDCPVLSSNKASGPGVQGFTSGHPLNVVIAVDVDTPGWTPVGRLIDHVFVLMLENRSFDHLLGFSGIVGTDAVSGGTTTVYGLNGSESNWTGGQEYTVSTPAPTYMARDPGHDFCQVLRELCGGAAVYTPGGPYPTPDNSGFAAEYGSMNLGPATPEQVMQGMSPEQVPVLTALATEFAVCDMWFSSLPGPTWPNRFFAMAASSGGLDHSPGTDQEAAWESGHGFEFEHGSLFELVDTIGSYRIYNGDVGPFSGQFPVAGGLHGVLPLSWRGFSHFAADVQGDYPYTFTFIEPNYGEDGSTYLRGTSQHPLDGVYGGEMLIKQVYEALRASPLWTSSMLIVTWDEHGGFYDHVPPGAATPPGDETVTTWPSWERVNEYGFPFNQYGVRVPAVVVSPYIAQNVIDHRVYDHSAIPKAVEELFGLSPLTARDAAANSPAALITLPIPRDCPTMLPGPVAPDPDAPSPLSVDDDDEPLVAGNLAGFVLIAQRLELATTPERDHQALRNKFRSIATNGDARRYVADVAERLLQPSSEPVVSGSRP